MGLWDMKKAKRHETVYGRGNYLGINSDNGDAKKQASMILAQ